MLWYGRDMFMSVTAPPLWFALFDLTVVLCLLLAVYRCDQCVYAMSGVLVISGFFLYLVALLGLLRFEFHVHRVHKKSMFFMDQVFENNRHTPLFLITLAALSWTTVVAVMDVQKE